MATAKHNPIAAALRSGRLCKPQTIPAKKGRGAPYRRKPRTQAKEAFAS